MDIAQYVLDFVNQTHRSIFLTGKAGTGKTTLLHQIIATTYKNVMVAARSILTSSIIKSSNFWSTLLL